MARILLLNGPNLNLLGTREPEIYGSASLQAIETKLTGLARARGHSLVASQSNAEHELIAKVQATKARRRRVRHHQSRRASPIPASRCATRFSRWRAVHRGSSEQRVRT